MANSTIPQLPPILALNGTEVVPVAAYISGEWVTFKATTALIAGLAGTVTTTTVAGLPSAIDAGSGARAFVTDANSTTFLATAVGGGSNKVPVVSNGLVWVIG